MYMYRTLSFAACLGILSVSALPGDDSQVVFHDDFNRDDSVEVGNEWSSRGTVVLEDKAILFRVNEEEFRPRVKRTFAAQKKGRLKVSFKMDWLRESEGTWSVHMQLGHSEEIPRLLVYKTDLSKGMGVHLVWGGGELVNNQPAGSFGYVQGGAFKPLFVVNDAKNNDSIVEDPTVEIEIDVDRSTYRVKFNDKTYPDIPFDNKTPIDTIRFITNGCSKSGFSKSSIDDVRIIRVE